MLKGAAEVLNPSCWKILVQGSCSVMELAFYECVEPSIYPDQNPNKWSMQTWIRCTVAQGLWQERAKLFILFIKQHISLYNCIAHKCIIISSDHHHNCVCLANQTLLFSAFQGYQLSMKKLRQVLNSEGHKDCEATNGHNQPLNMVFLG